METIPSPRPSCISCPQQSVERSLRADLDGQNRAFLDALKRKSEAAGLPVYLVGGPVRDALLERRVQDLDFVVEGDAVALARDMAADSGWDAVVHRRFGTATLAKGEARVDLVTARRESYPSPGALPEVVPGVILDDLARRDFSINSMAMPIHASGGEVLDPHGGMDDLSKKQVRILHPLSFVDDPTRLFRAVRYEQRFGFRLEGETEERLREAITERRLNAVTGDRLRHELERMFLEEDPGPALRRASEVGLLAAIHPELGMDAGASPIAPGSTSESSSALVRWATLVYPLSEGALGAVMWRLNVPSRWKRVAEDAVKVRQLEERLAAPGILPSEVSELLEGREEAALAAASLRFEKPTALRRLAEYLEEGRPVRTVLDGHAVIAMGVPPGHQVGKVLRRLKAARLDRLVDSEDEERALVAAFLAGTRVGGTGKEGRP